MLQTSLSDSGSTNQEAPGPIPEIGSFAAGSRSAHTHFPTHTNSRARSAPAHIPTSPPRPAIQFPAHPPAPADFAPAPANPNFANCPMKTIARDYRPPDLNALPP